MQLIFIEEIKHSLKVKKKYSKRPKFKSTSTRGSKSKRARI